MLNESHTLTESEAMRAPIEGLRRLCTFLGMPPGGTGERRGLVLWLAYMGHITVTSEATRQFLNKHS